MESAGNWGTIKTYQANFAASCNSLCIGNFKFCSLFESGSHSWTLAPSVSAEYEVLKFPSKASIGKNSHRLANEP